MKLSFTSNGKLSSLEIKAKLIGVSTDANMENVLYSALECGVSGDPMEAYHSYDGTGVGVSGVSLVFDEGHSMRLSHINSRWEYSLNGSVLRLHFIRGILNNGSYRCRTFVTECSAGGKVERLLKQDFYQVSEDLPLSVLLRVGNAVANAFTGIDFIAPRSSFQQGGISLTSKGLSDGSSVGLTTEACFIRLTDDAPSEELLRFLYELGILCYLNMDNAKKIIVLPIDNSSPFKEGVYKLIEFFASFNGVVHILFTAPRDVKLLKSLRFHSVRL